MRKLLFSGVLAIALILGVHHIAIPQATPVIDQAEDVGIEDAGGYFSSDNVEGALQELGAGGGSMVYPGAGIAVSTGSAWGTSLTDNHSNWDTAYGWGQGLKLDQSTPQTVTGGAPNFSGGLNVGSTSQFGVDASGNVLTTGTLSAGVSTLSTVNFGSATGVSATAAAGKLTLSGIGNTNNENLTFDFEANSNQVNIGSTSGVNTLYTGMGFSAAGTNSFAGSTNFNKSDIRTTPTFSLGLRNITNATALIPVQMSPYLSFQARVWDTGLSASTIDAFNQEVLGISGNPATARLRWGYMYNNSGTYIERMTLLSDGQLFLNTTDTDGTPAIGMLTVKGSTNDGSTNALVLRDSDEANIGTVDTNGVAVFNGGLATGGTTPTAQQGIFSVGGASSDNAYFFYDNADVGDTTNGQSLYVYRRAAEGDDYLRFYVDSGRSAICNLLSAGKSQMLFGTALSSGNSGVIKWSSSSVGLLIDTYASGSPVRLGGSKVVLGLDESSVAHNVLVDTTDDDGTPAVGRLTVKGSTNDGSTNALVLRDSDEANVATLDTNGKLTLSDDLAVNGGDITSTGDLTLDPAGNDVILDNANLQIPTNYKLQLRDAQIYINSTDDGYLDLVADTGIRLSNNTTIGTGAAGVDYTLTFNGETNDGVITWQEDEDTFDMSCNLSLATAGSKFGVGVSPSYPVHVQVRDQNAYCNYTDSQFSLSWVAPTIGLGSYLKNTGSESPVLGSHGMAVWGHYEDVASSQLMGIGTEGKVTAYGTGSIYGALVGYARFFNAGGTGPTGRIEGLHIKTEIAQSEGGAAINTGVGVGVYVEPLIGAAAATRYAMLVHDKVAIAASEGSTDRIYLSRSSSSADIVVEGNDNLNITVPSGKNVVINDNAAALAPSSSAGADLGANGAEWGALYQKGITVYAPSATQTIDAAGDTILANAGTIILDPGTSSDYTLTSTPTIADGYPGQRLTIIIATTSNKAVIIQDQDTLANSNIQLPWNNLSIGVRDVVTLVFNGADWCLAERQDN